MYVRVLQDELQFPDDRAIDQDTKSLIRGVSALSQPVLLFVSNIGSAFTTQSCIENVRASSEETPVFLNDVRFYSFLLLLALLTVY